MKNRLIVSFFIIFFQVDIMAISKEDYLKAFQQIEKNSPDALCLKEHNINSCLDLYEEFGKPIYLETLRKNILSSSNITQYKLYLKYERDNSYRTKVLNRLKEIGTKDALFLAFEEGGRDFNDLEKVVNLIDEDGETDNKEIMNAYYYYTVKSIKDFPNFINKFQNQSQYNKKIFMKKIAQSDMFGKNLNIDNFFDSIEYKYIIKNLDYTLTYKEHGKKYDITLSLGNSIKPIIFSFNAICKYSRDITQREDVGFLESLGSGGAIEKDVKYSINECKPLQSDDKNKIYKLYANANQLDKYNQLKNAKWDYKVKIGQEYIASKDNSSGRKDYCFSSDIRSDRDRNICLANATGKESYCYASGLSSSDRQICLASVKKQDSYCFSSDIKSDRDRQMCLASATRKEGYCFSSDIKSDRDRNICLANATEKESYCYASGLSSSDRQMCLAHTK